MQDIEVCRRPDGSEWVLGRGRHSQVLKAIKGGVQVSGSLLQGKTDRLWGCWLGSAVGSGVLCHQSPWSPAYGEGVSRQHLAKMPPAL